MKCLRCNEQMQEGVFHIRQSRGTPSPSHFAIRAPNFLILLETSADCWPLRAGLIALERAPGAVGMKTSQMKKLQWDRCLDRGE
jgi:hypothetical protein